MKTSNLWKTADSSVTASAAVALEIHLPKCRTSAASQSDLTKKVKTLLCRVASLDVNAVILGKWVSSTFKKYRSSFAQSCGRNLTTEEKEEKYHKDFDFSVLFLICPDLNSPRTTFVLTPLKNWQIPKILVTLLDTLRTAHPKEQLIPFTPYIHL